MMYIVSPLVCPGCTQINFRRFGAEKDLSDVSFAAGKNKSKPKTFQTPENTILSLSETDSFDNFYGIVKSEISGQLIANIYSVVSELEAQAYFDLKLRKIVFCRFPTLIQCSISMHGRWTQMQWAVLVEYRKEQLLFPVSISSCVDTFLKTETYCCFFNSTLRRNRFTF